MSTPMGRGTPVAVLSDEVLGSPGSPGNAGSPSNEAFDATSVGGWPSSRTNRRNAHQAVFGNGGSVMMPRSSRSIRHSVSQARGAVTSSPVLDTVVMMPVNHPSTPSMVRRMPPSLGADVTSSTGTASWLVTPKNSDSRDMNGSVQMMAPLWRGSGSITPSQIQSKAAFHRQMAADPSLICGTPAGKSANMSTSLLCGTPVGCSGKFTGGMLLGTPLVTSPRVAPNSPPLGQHVMPAYALPVRTTAATTSSLSVRRGVPTTPLGAESSQAVPQSWLSTPKNGDRRDMHGSVQLMTPLWRGSSSTVQVESRPARPAVAVTQHRPPGYPSGGYPSATGLELSATSVLLPGPSTPAGRIGNIAMLGEEACTSAPVMAAAAFATPKNADRRDMNSSMQMMVPLWRGSAAAPQS